MGSIRPTKPATSSVPKSALKLNRSSAVLAALLPHIEQHAIEDKDAPVRRAHRYLQNRRGQLDYQGAIEKNCL